MSWFLRFALRAVLPSGGELKGVGETGLDAFLKRFRREATLLMRLGLYAGAFVLIWSPILTVYLPLPAFLLPRGLRERHMRKVASHPIYLVRQAILAVKVTAGLCWGQDPEVRRRLGVAALGPDPGTWKRGA